MTNKPRQVGNPLAYYNANRREHVACQSDNDHEYGKPMRSIRGYLFKACAKCGAMVKRVDIDGVPVDDRAKERIMARFKEQQQENNTE